MAAGLVDKIAALIPQSVPFHYGEWEQLNTIADGVQTPAAYMLPISNGKLQLVGGSMCEQADCQIFFATSSAYTFDEVGEHGERIDDALVNERNIVKDVLPIVADFITGLKDSAEITVVRDYTLRRLYREFSGYYSGIVLAVTLRENEGVCVS